MSERVKKIERALIQLLKDRRVDVGMDPDFTTQAKAIGGMFFINRRSKSNLPERRASKAGLWSADFNNREIDAALEQIEFGVERLAALEPEIYMLLKLNPKALNSVRDFVSDIRERKATGQEVIDVGISPKRLQNVDLVVLMERALNGAIWAHHDAGVKTIRIPTKLTGRPWVAYFEAVAKALDVNFDNHERNYQTMLKARKALAARQKLLRK